MPIAPPPNIKMRHSWIGRSRARIDKLIACTAVAAGSVNAAASRLSPSGTAMSEPAGMLIYSANAPGLVMPTMVRLAHKLFLPCKQYSQCPQVIRGLPVTLWP